MNMGRKMVAVGTLALAGVGLSALVSASAVAQPGGETGAIVVVVRDGNYVKFLQASGGTVRYCSLYLQGYGQKITCDAWI